MKIALSIETMWRDVPFYDRFAKVREAGFGYVEFDGWTELVFSRVTEQLNRYDLRLASISGARPHSLLDPERHEDFLEYLSQTIAVAKSFACPNIVIASEAGVRDSVRPGSDGKSAFTKIAAAIRVLTEASAMAAKAGVTLLVKSVGETPFDMPPRGIPGAGDVVRMVSSPALRMLYEAKRGEQFDASAVSALHKYRDVINYVQVIDGRALPPHAVDDLAGIRTALTRELNYNGIVGFRLQTTGDEALCLEEIKSF